MKYCVQFWSLYYRQDIVEIEKVQWRATKMIQDLGDMNDEDKLAGFRLCYLRAQFFRTTWAPLQGCPAPRASPAPAAERQPPRTAGEGELLAQLQLNEK